MSKTSSKPSSTRKASPAKAAAKRPALVGGNLADGTRFEEGDDLAELDTEALASLEANGVIAPATTTTEKGE